MEGKQNGKGVPATRCQRRGIAGRWDHESRPEWTASDLSFGIGADAQRARRAIVDRGARIEAETLDLQVAGLRRVAARRDGNQAVSAGLATFAPPTAGLLLEVPDRRFEEVWIDRRETDRLRRVGMSDGGQALPDQGIELVGSSIGAPRGEQHPGDLCIPTRRGPVSPHRVVEGESGAIELGQFRLQVELRPGEQEEDIVGVPVQALPEGVLGTLPVGVRQLPLHVLTVNRHRGAGEQEPEGQGEDSHRVGSIE